MFLGHTQALGVQRCYEVCVCFVLVVGWCGRGWTPPKHANTGIPVWSSPTQPSPQSGPFRPGPLDQQPSAENGLRQRWSSCTLINITDRACSTA